MARTGRPRIPLIFEASKDGKIPAKPIDFNQVLYWIQLDGTAEEIAGSFFVSSDVLTERLKEHFGLTFAELKERCGGAAKLKLRQNQLKLSEKNGAMAIWLGKVWLGQRDESEEEFKRNSRSELIEFLKELRQGNELENTKRMEEINEELIEAANSRGLCVSEPEMETI